MPLTSITVPDRGTVAYHSYTHKKGVVELGFSLEGEFSLADRTVMCNAAVDAHDRARPGAGVRHGVLYVRFTTSVRYEQAIDRDVDDVTGVMLRAIATALQSVPKVKQRSGGIVSDGSTVAPPPLSYDNETFDETVKRLKAEGYAAGRRGGMR